MIYLLVYILDIEIYSILCLDCRERPSLEGGSGGIKVGVHVLFSSDLGKSIIVFCLVVVDEV